MTFQALFEIRIATSVEAGTAATNLPVRLHHDFTAHQSANGIPKGGAGKSEKARMTRRLSKKMIIYPAVLG